VTTHEATSAQVACIGGSAGRASRPGMQKHATSCLLIETRPESMDKWAGPNGGTKHDMIWPGPRWHGPVDLARADICILAH
jgi:hypothetical protein